MTLLRRLLGIDDGWGGAIGLLLLLGFGLVFVGIGASRLTEASQRAPVELDCATLVSSTRPPKWVRAVNCEPLPAGLRIEGEGFTGIVEREGDGLVLHAGRGPERLKLLTPLFVGLVAVALAVRTMFRRWLVERDASV
ncbi:MAG: hypothetical protein DI536_08910 [Archangium gephyra]|uniref:Uncharacterized protein n=1 Tax=Archangium gephyra TaxID=48 RepID=A0A2W5TU89_9BACT|nr:MAG: hypothetical protein DI536_08910 [Archangium gephyra]